MSRIDELIAELCPSGVEYKALGDVGKFVRGNGLQKKDLADIGVGAIHYVRWPRSLGQVGGGNKVGSLHGYAASWRAGPA